MGFDRFVGARRIAIVGASPRNTIARIVADNLQRLGFPGTVVGVHPSGESDGDLQVVPSLAEAEADLAVLAIGAPRLAAAVREAGDAGIRAVVIPGAGANEGGREIEQELRAAVDAAGVEVIGPNCMGFASLHERVAPYVGTLDPALQAGHVALVSQSGSVCELFTALPWRVGFSHVVSVGNELTLDLTGALEFLIDDERTRAVGLFVEGIRRPAEFRAALRLAADAGVTIVALKVGRSDASREGTVAHTGALAGDERVFSAILGDAGAIAVRDLDEMLTLLELLGKPLRRAPERVVFAGDSGGQANLFADLAADHGIELPPLEPSTASALRERFPTIGDTSNPLDLWALGDPERSYADGIRLLVERQRNLVVLGLDKFLARGEPERVFVRAGVEAVPEPGVVVLTAFAGGEVADEAILRAAWERGVPVTRGAGATLSALAALARGRDRPGDADAHPAPSVPEEAIRVAGETSRWSEHDAKRLLEAAGIEVTREEEAGNPQEAAAAAERLGFPVVVKASAPGLAHKTEIGGVRLHLATPDQVAVAAADLLELGPRVLVAQQVETDLELVAGAFVDPQFGPCGLIGLGGTWTEAFGEAVVVAGPGSRTAFDRALETQRWGRLLLRGARGRAFPVRTVWRIVSQLIALVEACDLGVVEINPLFLDGDRAVAVDALVVPGD